MPLQTIRRATPRGFLGAICALGASQKSAIVLVVSLALGAASGTASAQTAAKTPQGLDPIRSYISAGWDSLTRSLTECKTIVDTKLTTASVLYIPADFETPAAVQQLQKQCNVQAQHLPIVIHNLGEADPGRIDPAGLLYLPSKYVVPGGRFNEMYGWDSYFIIRGLVRDNRLDLAQGMVENFFFEIEHYGAVLNANRTYYLTRSQPPFLTSMILAVYEGQKAAGHEDRAWLEKAYGYAVRDYGLWTREPLLRFRQRSSAGKLERRNRASLAGSGVFPGASRLGPRLFGPDEERRRIASAGRTTVRAASLRDDHDDGTSRVRFGRKRHAERGLLQGRPRHARVRL
jgi:Trehalase